MKIAEINMTQAGSTGKIMLQVADCARKSGHEVLTFSVPSFSFGRPEKMPEIANHIYFGSYLSRGIHTVAGILTGCNGFFSVFATVKLIRSLKRFSPDVIHLHNLHQFCVNLPLLFRYIKKCGAKIVWTLHDCWSFTGHCAHFDYVGCDKWKTGCHGCPQYTAYPKSKLDNSRWMYRLKKKWFTGISDMTLVAPSSWLADLVKQSYLGDYQVKVIHNGIDLSIFKPTESDFRTRFGCEDKFILLGVAFPWGSRKGLDVMTELAARLDSSYQIVLVGTDEFLEKDLPDNIISIRATHSQKELAEIYSAADLYVNPTREEVLGLVNLEALACGTPVVTFASGGSPECVDESCGQVVSRDDLEGLIDKIKRIRADLPYPAECCIAKASTFDKQLKFQEYVELFEEK